MPGKVLIADDSLKIQKELTALLKGAGIEAVTVSNGEHAVRKLPTVQPDVVLADIFMPVRDGYEVCDFVKSSAEFPHTRVVLLVSKMEPYDDKRAKQVRADGKIEKPISEDPAGTLAAIKQHLDKVLAARPAPAPPPIDEFAAAVPAEAAAEPEPEVFSTRRPDVQFGEQAPMGFTDMVASEAPAPVLPAVMESGPVFTPSVSEVAAPEEEVVDLSQATMLTSADELQRRIADEHLEPAAAPAAFEEPAAYDEPAPAEVVSVGPAAETPTVMATSYDTLVGEKPREVEKPVLAEAWEMTGPQPGAPPVPVVGGFVSQWTTEEGSAEPAAVEAPASVEEVAAPPAPAAYAPEEFAAAMQAALDSQPVTPPSPEEEVAAATPVAVEEFPTPGPELDPAVVDEIVNRVLERLTPQVMEQIGREIVRPLAESLLREKLR
ncbi:MAG TPA: response regulator [Candidatus Acidoferrales bacterium]|nr:response regulator [Candidatus Acidoferrales bacterium]